MKSHEALMSEIYQMLNKTVNNTAAEYAFLCGIAFGVNLIKENSSEEIISAADNVSMNFGFSPTIKK